MFGQPAELAIRVEEVSPSVVHISCCRSIDRSVLPGLAPVAIVASSIWLAWALWARRGEHAVASGALLLALSVAHLSQVASASVLVAHGVGVSTEVRYRLPLIPPKRHLIPAEKLHSVVVHECLTPTGTGLAPHSAARW